jgi:hypothetical protein
MVSFINLDSLSKTVNVINNSLKKTHLFCIYKKKCLGLNYN